MVIFINKIAVSFTSSKYDIIPIDGVKYCEEAAISQVTISSYFFRVRTARKSLLLY